MKIWIHIHTKLEKFSERVWSEWRYLQVLLPSQEWYRQEREPIHDTFHAVQHLSRSFWNNQWYLCTVTFLKHNTTTQQHNNIFNVREISNLIVKKQYSIIKNPERKKNDKRLILIDVWEKDPNRVKYLLSCIYHLVLAFETVDEFSRDPKEMLHWFQQYLQLLQPRASHPNFLKKMVDSALVFVSVAVAVEELPK